MYGLVLEGGGARGAYHIGAYKAILDEGIEIGGIAGTSVGALNGAIIAQGDYEKAYEIWHEMSYSKVINASDEEIEKLRHRKLDREDIYLFTEKIKGVFSEKGLDITPLKKLMTEFVDEDKIRSSGKDFGIVTVSLTDLKPLEIYIEDIPQGKLVEYLMASAYFPLFKREKIDGKKYIDGGLYNNLPVNLLINKGYKDLILVRTNALGIVKKVDLKELNTIIISPKEDLGKTLDFDGEIARYNLKLGYYDGLKALKGLKGTKYYLEPRNDEDYFMDCLLDLGEEEILELGKTFKIDGAPSKRILFEFIMPKISNILGVEKESNYIDLFYCLLEKLAEIYEIERFTIYTYDELLNLIKEKLKMERDKDLGIIDKIIEKVDILSIFTKEETIKEIGRIILDK